jgi:hypothetical protein
VISAFALKLNLLIDFPNAPSQFALPFLSEFDTTYNLQLAPLAEDDGRQLQDLIKHYYQS